MSASKRSTIIVEHLRKQQMWDALAKGKRLDGRAFDQQRPLEIEIDVIKKANGSARVKLGDSEVIAGIKVETGEPIEGLENKGALIVTAEVLPIASPILATSTPISLSLVLMSAPSKSAATPARCLAVTRAIS